MRKLTIAEPVLTAMPALQAAAEEAYIPPLIEATVFNTSGAPLEGVELVLVGAGGLWTELSREALAVGPMAVAKPVAVGFDPETYEPSDLVGEPAHLSPSSSSTAPDH